MAANRHANTEKSCICAVTPIFDTGAVCNTVSMNSTDTSDERSHCGSTKAS